jgi:hypothetical protein
MGKTRWILRAVSVATLLLSGLATVAGCEKNAPEAKPEVQQPSDERNDERNAVTLTQAGSQPVVEPEKGTDTCPADMVLVEGTYCTDVRHTCKKWLDDPNLPYARCGEYKEEARCVGKKVEKRFCIDRYEYTAPGEKLPANYLSFMKGSQICKEQGKRICLESEWTFACEGEEMRPYPYGWTREAVCNYDRENLYETTPTKRVMLDHREPADARKECVSPFGVYNMVGNVDETTFRDGSQHMHPFRNSLKGGWWMAARNRCRPATVSHDDYYNDIQVGVRCCADASGSDIGSKG